MSQRISEETGNTEYAHNSEHDLSHLPQLPPGVYIPAPTQTPRRTTRWPDTIDVIFAKDPACRNIFDAILRPITIGRGSKIGAMALVLESVPPNSVVASKPAELLVKGGEALEKHQELTQGWNSKDPWEMDYQI